MQLLLGNKYDFNYQHDDDGTDAAAGCSMDIKYKFIHTQIHMYVMFIKTLSCLSAEQYIHRRMCTCTHALYFIVLDSLTKRQGIASH